VVCRFGDPSGASPDLFEGCEVIVSETIQNSRVAPAPMESRAAAAVWGEDGRLTAWIPNQGAQGTKMAVAGGLGVKPDNVRIITPDVGGAFGAKFGADAEALFTCRVARELGRPARWSETRNDNLLGMTHGRAQRQQVTIGGTRDGTILAYRLEIIQDCGAYPKAGAFLPSLTILMTPGPYNIPRAEAWSTSVVTSTTPVGAYRGAGRPEAAAAIDRAVDLFADAAGVDAAQVRRKNLLPKFTEPHTTAFGAKYDSGDYVTALERALEAAGYEGLLAEQAKRRANGAPLGLQHHRRSRQFRVPGRGADDHLVTVDADAGQLGHPGDRSSAPRKTRSTPPSATSRTTPPACATTGSASAACSSAPASSSQAARPSSDSAGTCWASYPAIRDAAVSRIR
jgi:carbon-monoxide dehydrogenase large subunit